MELPTCTIETKNGPVVINEADFDPAVHKLAKGEKPSEALAAKMKGGEKAPAKKTAARKKSK